MVAKLADRPHHRCWVAHLKTCTLKSAVGKHAVTGCGQLGLRHAKTLAYALLVATAAVLFESGFAGLENLLNAPGLVGFLYLRNNLTS